MKQYIGTKIVQAEPAVRIMDIAFNVRVVPLTEHPITHPDDTVDLGYKIRYEDGYESFSPQDVFEKAYRESDGLPFGLAIEAAKMGKRIARKGWNGKNQYVEMAYCISYKNHAAEVVNANHCNIGNKALAFVGTSGVQLGWLASQADMLADDWYVVE